MALDLKNPDYILPSGFNFNGSDGPPYMSVIFGFSVFKKWHFNVNYSYLSSAFTSDFNNSSKQSPVELKKGSGIYLMDLKIDQIRLGIGLEYDF